MIESDAMQILKGYVFRMYPNESKNSWLIKLFPVLDLYMIIFWI